MRKVEGKNLSLKGNAILKIIDFSLMSKCLSFHLAIPDWLERKKAMLLQNIPRIHVENYMLYFFT